MSVRVFKIEEVVADERYDLQRFMMGQWMYGSNLMYVKGSDIPKILEDGKKYGDQYRILTARD